MRSDALALLPILRSRHLAEIPTVLLLHPDVEYTLSELAATLGLPTSSSPHAVTNAKGEFSISVKPSATTTYTTEVIANEPWPYCLYVYDTTFAQTTITVVNPK